MVKNAAKYGSGDANKPTHDLHAPAVSLVTDANKGSWHTVPIILHYWIAHNLAHVIQYLSNPHTVPRT